MEKILDPMVAYQGIFPFDESRAKGMSDNQIAAFLSKHAVFDRARLAILLPALLLGVMVEAGWVVRNF
jgi:hypothetical protein